MASQRHGECPERLTEVIESKGNARQRAKSARWTPHLRSPSPLQSEHVNTRVLSEMVIEGERPSDPTALEHGE